MAVAVDRDIAPGQRTVTGRPAAAYPDLLAHNIYAGDHFGDRMLDLDAGVHFDEIEPAIVIGNRRFESSIASWSRHQPHAVQFATLILIDGGRRGFFQNLLVPALHGTVALAQMHHLAKGNRHPAEIDMALIHSVPDTASSPAALASVRAVERARQPLLSATFMPRPPPPAARFDQKRIAEFRGHLKRHLVRSDRAI